MSTGNDGAREGAAQKQWEGARGGGRGPGGPGYLRGRMSAGWGPGGKGQEIPALSSLDHLVCYLPNWNPPHPGKQNSVVESVSGHPRPSISFSNHRDRVAGKE